MSQEPKENNKKTGEEPDEGSIGRRDLLKGLATIPVIGVFLYSLFKKRSYDKRIKKSIFEELGLSREAPAVLPKYTMKKPGQLIRLGIIGFGGRGEALVRSSGFAHPDWIEKKKKDALKNKRDKTLKHFLEQEDLNIVYNGVCDVFDIRAERGLATAGKSAKRYIHYQELLASKDIDAVIIATPDHWHARMVIDAAKAGKHVYVEKCMTRTVDEVYRVVDAVKKSNIVFQLGHQGREAESYIKAREIMKKNILGKVTLVVTSTNRNDPNGAWVYKIHKDASPKNIDWEQFLGPAPRRPFSLERFFRWRCWYDYGTGLSGDLFTHEYDAVNQIMDLGIPRSAVASGGIYFFKDGRDVPDVYQVVYEYPDKDLTLVYSATLASEKRRGKVFMGHDASMEVGGSLTVTVDPRSTKYKKKIEEGIIDLSLPLFVYSPGLKGIDVVTSATEKYFAGRGLMYTFRGGKIVDTTHLHIKNWLDCIRNGGKTSCNIDLGFQEAITAHMGTISYREGRKVYWDPVKQKIV
ncbi:gfo/Idh/MocA family oxidoreductase [candidate division KSB1 bacterium]|nr:MAG: gfo/Idh/MocA family oxidoreductase [candidate division KSB1 bacterium]